MNLAQLGSVPETARGKIFEISFFNDVYHKIRNVELDPPTTQFVEDNPFLVAKLLSLTGVVNLGADSLNIVRRTGYQLFMNLRDAKPQDDDLIDSIALCLSSFTPPMPGDFSPEEQVLLGVSRMNNEFVRAILPIIPNIGALASRQAITV